MDGASIDGAMSAHEAQAAVRAYLLENPGVLLDDPELLRLLGLQTLPENVVAFGPAALARVHAAHRKESAVRRQLESTARANFAAQAHTHGAVIDLLEARNHADLARRVDDLAQLRFALCSGVVALEGPERTPAGWRPLVEGQVDMILGGHQKLTRMGFWAPALGLFGDRSEGVKSMALVRLAMWEPAREGLVAFGSDDPNGFTEDMGAELVAFLARVIERTAERWPVL
jgi:uncharacterized protein